MVQHRPLRRPHALAAEVVQHDEVVASQLADIRADVGHPRAGRLLDPYAGGGFIYSKKKTDRTGWTNHFGYTALMGLNFLLLHRTTIGGYGEFVVPDWQSTEGYWEYGFSFSGLSL